MKVEHPTTGKLIELPEAQGYGEDSVFHGNTNRAKEFDKAGTPDGVLRLDDRPAGVSEADWRTYITGLAEWAEVVPQARAAAERLKDLARVVGTQSSTISQHLIENARSGALGEAAEALKPHGLSLVPDAGSWSGVPHFTVSGGQGLGNFIPVGSGDAPAVIVLRALLADGRLPEAATSFIASLPEPLRPACTRLLVDAKIIQQQLMFGEQPVNLIRQLAAEITLRDGKLQIVMSGGTHSATRGTLRVEEDAGLLKLSLMSEGHGAQRADVRGYFIGPTTPLDRPLREGARPRW